MNFASCNRLVQEKQNLMNDRYHRLKLEEIRHSRHKEEKTIGRIADLRRKFQEAEKQREIIRGNGHLLNKLNNIMDKPLAPVEPPHSKPKQPQRHVVESYFQQPRNKQKSSYSLERLEQERKFNNQYSKGGSNARKQGQGKQGTKDMSTVLDSSNKEAFDNYLRLFNQMGLEEPDQNHFTQPQNLAQRVIVFRKAVLIEGNSYLIEISSAYGRVFIVAHNMTSNNGQILRLRFSEHKARELFAEYDYDFAAIVSKIDIDDKKMTVRMPLKEDNNADKEAVEKPYQKQVKFIRRNYYEAVDKHNRAKSRSKAQEPVSSPGQARKKYHSNFQQQPINSNPQTLSKRFRYEKFNKSKKFSLAVTMKQSSQKKIRSITHNVKTVNQSIDVNKDRYEMDQQIEQDKNTSQLKDQSDGFDQIFEYEDSDHSIKIQEEQAALVKPKVKEQKTIGKDHDGIQESMDYDNDLQNDKVGKNIIQEEYIDDFQA